MPGPRRHRRLHDELKQRVAAHPGRQGKAEAKPDVFVLRGEQVSTELATGLSTAARIVLEQSAGTLAQQVDRLLQPAVAVRAQRHVVPPPQPRDADADTRTDFDETGLEFFNGYGGFDKDGREYVTLVRNGRLPPMPWLNVVANAEFGFTTTEAGGGYAWALNSQRNTLTPWTNDPVVDPPQEILYLRDEEDGRLWTATALSGSDHAGTYEVRHGQGYSCFRHNAHGIELELLQYVPVADGIKISRLRLRNRSGRVRRLSVTAFVQWALGANGTQPAPFVETRIDPATGALFARNAWRPEFGERVAFMDLRGQQASHTGDRTEFLGRHGTLAAPAVLRSGEPLSGRVGAGLDPCGALQARIELAADDEGEVALLFGDADTDESASELVRQYRDADLDEVLQAATRAWDEILGTVQVKTPDRAMDLLLNRWLVYQALGCRVWARTGYYQASGAYGFRDQLQDVMAVCVARPDEARAQLLRAAGRQFVEGDVQHWWLPPSGEGVRTRMTDDRLWLPFVASHYIEATADTGILDTRQPFLAGEVLKPGQDEAFFRPSIADTDASLYEHCALAIDISLSLGAHGLPLFGTGDWNDGMNRVGEEGRGESSWLGWFLAATIDAFAPHAIAREDHARAQRWQACAATVRKALDDGGWDGAWYRRGYYDDGTPLGSHGSSECRIDAIAQSWSVIAGGGDPGHARSAMQAVDEHLVWRDEKLAPLFTPPFEQRRPRPGLHQGISAWHPRERWPVHPRLAVVDLRAGEAGRGRPRRRTVLADQPDPSRRHARGGRALQGRTVRCLRGCVFGSAARGARRLDLVHRFRCMAVPRRPGGDPGFPAAGRAPVHRSVHPARLAGLLDRVPAWQQPLSGRSGKSAPRGPRRCTRRTRWRSHRGRSLPCTVAGRWRRASGQDRARHLNAFTGSGGALDRRGSAPHPLVGAGR